MYSLPSYAKGGAPRTGNKKPPGQRYRHHKKIHEGYGTIGATGSAP